MHFGKGFIKELYLDSSAHIECAPNLIPAPGQYLLAHAPGSSATTADPVYLYDSAPDGFRASLITDASWLPGAEVRLRGPLGHGFKIPDSARKIALVCMESSMTTLHAVMKSALGRGCEATILCDTHIPDLPEAIEMQPLKSAEDVLQWADYVAADVERERLPRLNELFGAAGQAWAVNEAQVFIRAPMPCGGMAECGVCALTTSNFWKMACKDGPVFDWRSLRG